MTEYLVRRSSDGDPLVILEAADRTDAELYASRNLTGVGDIVEVPSAEVAETRLQESMADAFGLSESAAKIAAEGRGSEQPRVRRIVVPRQLAGGATVELTEAQHGRQETIADADLEGAFLDMGFSESAAKIAARGRN